MQAVAEEANLEAVITALEALLEPRRRLAKVLAGGSGDCGGRLRRGLGRPALHVVMPAPYCLLEP